MLKQIVQKSKNKVFTGVGSRNTPPEIITVMQSLSQWLANKGWTLRSGGAQGADTAFESGAKKKTIFYANQANAEAMRIAGSLHPAWNRCSEYAKKLHGRNAFQVLGSKLNRPSDFVICWTPDGCETHEQRSIQTGGTGTAISIADTYGIPVFNLKNIKCLLEVVRLIK